MQFQCSLFARWPGIIRQQTICLTFFLLLLKASVVNTRKINPSLQVSAVFFAKEGGSISLHCPCAKNGTITSFAWLCPKQEYFSQFSQQLDHKNNNGGKRVPVNSDNSNNYRRGIGRQTIVNGSLEITTVCGSDAGIYKCLADSECVDCAICQATVELEVARIGSEGNLDIPACSKEIRASPERYHYSDWTYGALIFSAGLVLGLALAMFIVIFRRRSRKRFGSSRGSDLSISKDSLMRCRSIIERQKTASIRHTAAHLLQKTRTISHRWMPIREESYQESESIMTAMSAFEDPAYGMYVNPLRSRQSTRGSSIPMGPPPLPPRPRPPKKVKQAISSGSSSLILQEQIPEIVEEGDSSDDYEEADDTTLTSFDGDLEMVKLDNLEDSDGYVKMTIPSRPGSEMPSIGRISSYHPNASILKDFALAMVPPESRRNAQRVSYMELVT